MLKAPSALFDSLLSRDTFCEDARAGGFFPERLSDLRRPAFEGSFDRDRERERDFRALGIFTGWGISGQTRAREFKKVFMTDIDDLLDELDLDDTNSGKKGRNGYNHINPAVSTTCLKVEQKPTKMVSLHNSEDVDVDSLLDDLDSISPTTKVVSRNIPNSDDPKAKSAQGPAAAPAMQRKGKCITVSIGGTRDQQGMGPGYACDRLRCSKCDFNVARFTDTAWSERCDYLFFRNFFPDPEKLRANMESKKGTYSFYSKLIQSM